MKKLYIRFFNNIDDEIPINSTELKIKIFLNETWFEIQFDDEISDWMHSHSNGRVDFVWL